MVYVSPFITALALDNTEFNEIFSVVDVTFDEINKTFCGISNFHKLNVISELTVPEWFRRQNELWRLESRPLLVLYWQYLLLQNIKQIYVLKELLAASNISQAYWDHLKPHVWAKRIESVIMGTAEPVNTNGYEGMAQTHWVIWSEIKLSSEKILKKLSLATTQQVVHGTGIPKFDPLAPAPVEAQAPSPWPQLARLANLVEALAETRQPLLH